MQTTVLWNGHASVLIRYGDTILLTDPWYGVAFSSWTPCPAPFINPDVLVGMARAGKLAVIVSHAHGDHFDRSFLDRLPRETKIFAPAWERDHIGRETFALGHAPITLGAAKMHALKAPHSAVVTIETPDAFVAHGNDVYALNANLLLDMRGVKPTDKPSLYMGQGGSASGWPIRYRYSDAVKQSLVEWKSERYVEGLLEIADSCGFDAVLPYAYLAACHADNQTWYPRHPNGHYQLLELHPSDTYIPATGQIVRGLPTLDATDYPHAELPKFLYRHVTPALVEAHIRPFLDGIEPLCRQHGIRFEITMDAHTWGRGEGPNRKRCFVKKEALYAVLVGHIPFDDLATGFLAEWEREPDRYNEGFVNALTEYGYQWMEKCSTRRQAA